MPFAAINGLTVLFTAFNEEEPLYLGEDVRSVSHRLLSSVREPKMRRWSGTTVPYTDAAWAEIRGELEDALGYVTCTGDAFGGTFTCKARVTAMPYERAARASLPPHAVVSTGFERTYTITLEQAE
jgi:hypothetical protein